jgi:diadenosine tetraphosphate (Ap4A) HIT family hydrolase
MNPAAFALDPQLAADTIAVGDLALCRVLLNDDANYPWLILVPRRAGLVELSDVDEAMQNALMDEVSQAARALKGATHCDKLNVAALGNVVTQLHVHVIARFRTDAAWPNPVWGKVPRKPYDVAARDALIDTLRGALQSPPPQG